MHETYRADDWQNTVAGFGTIRDKHTATAFAPRARLGRHTLTWLYSQSWIVARIVDKIVDDAFRTPWRFASISSRAGAVDEAEVHSRLADWGLEPKVQRLLKWGRLYGGALLLLPSIGTGRPDQPMNLTAPTALYRPWVVAADDAVPMEMDVGWGSPTFGEVLSYDVTGLLTSTVRVHASRTIKHEPIDLPWEALQYSPNRWGPSIIERPYPEIERDGAAASHSVAMMYLASILYIKLKNLRRWTQAKDGKEQVRQVLSAAREQLDALGLLGLDTEDEIGNLSVTATSVHELALLIKGRVAACVDGMPAEILFNEAPTGLRGGELSGAQAIWNGTVKSFRRSVIEPILDRALEVAFAAWRMPVDSWAYAWDPVFEGDAKEQGENYKTTAEADALMIDRGVLTADDIRAHRFEQGNAFGPPRVEGDAPVEPLGLDLDPEEIEAHEQAQASAPEVEPAKEALNGAQWAQIVSIGEKVKAGLVTRDQGVAMIQAGAPSIPLGLVEGIVGPVGPVVAPQGGPGGPGMETPTDGPPLEAGDLMRVQEVAARLGLPTRAITRAAERGEIRSRGLGSHKLVSLSEVWRVLNGEGPPPAAQGEPPEPTEEPLPQV